MRVAEKLGSLATVSATSLSLRFRAQKVKRPLTPASLSSPPLSRHPQLPIQKKTPAPHPQRPTLNPYQISLNPYQISPTPNPNPHPHPHPYPHPHPPQGPSAGQTAILLLIDSILGVSHGEQMRSFRLDMRSYLPFAHAALLADVETRLGVGGLPATVARCAPDDPDGLCAAYQEAIKALAAMRAVHLGIASRYLRRTAVGTGATDFRSLLSEALKSTRESTAECD